MFHSVIDICATWSTHSLYQLLSPSTLQEYTEKRALLHYGDNYTLLQNCRVMQTLLLYTTNIITTAVMDCAVGLMIRSVVMALYMEGKYTYGHVHAGASHLP